jgi:hypothetical protein
MNEPSRPSDTDVTDMLRRRSALPAPDGLASAVLESLASERARHPVRTAGRSAKRPLVLLAAAALLLVGGAMAAGSGLVRLPSVVPPEPAPSLAAVRALLEPSGSLSPGGDVVTAITMADGRILVGGYGAGDGELAQIFDPNTSSTEPIRIADRNVALLGAGQLHDGLVLLIAWIYGEPAALGRSVGYVYDPSTGTVRPAGPMTAPRFEPAMATLADGRVLITGGLPNQEAPDALATAEIYDPTTNAFSPTGRMGQARIEHALTLLDDGTVLVSGGAGVKAGIGVQIASLERYDPISGTFSPSGPGPNRIRPPRVAPVRLPDGRILLVGGPEQRCGRHGIDAIPTYLFDPTTGILTEAPRLPHDVTTATLLLDGRVLVSGEWTAIGPAPGGCGGNGGNVTDDWLGIYDPATGVTLTSLDPFTGVATLAVKPDKPYLAATRLPDGRVALIGQMAVDIFR